MSSNDVFTFNVSPLALLRRFCIRSMQLNAFACVFFSVCAMFSLNDTWPELSLLCLILVLLSAAGMILIGTLVPRSTMPQTIVVNRARIYAEKLYKQVSDMAMSLYVTYTQPKE